MTNTKQFDKARQSFSYFEHLPFRPQQEEGLDFLHNSNAKHVLFNMPTGSGKSLMGMTAGRIHGSMAYLCSTKMLQDQLEADFPEAMVMKGRNNYPCLLHDNLAADSCTHSKQRPCRQVSRCPYLLQKKAVVAHPLKILNYSYFISEVNTAGQFANANVVVCDEADMLENILVNYISLNISTYMIEKYKLGEPKFKTATAKEGVSSWKNWLKKAYSKLARTLVSTESKLWEAVGYNDGNGMEILSKQKKRLENYLSKMDIMMDALDDTWLWSRTDKAWEFRPIWLTPELTQQFFFRHSDRFLMMSATLPAEHVTTRLLGLCPEEVDYTEMDSTFPVENRMVYVDAAYDLTRDSFESQVPLVLKKVREVLDRHPYEKGIIHSVSYRLAGEIMKLGDIRLGTHASDNKESVMKKFKQSKNPLVLVSPSIVRGEDFVEDECRFQIWAKCPHLNLGDKVTQARAYSGKFGNLWYKASAAQALVQGSGRGIRSAEDRCVTYILDKQAKDLITKNVGLFPRWFKDAIQFM